MNSATLSLYSTGETTGLVIESGEGMSTVVPIFEVKRFIKGYPIYHALQSTKLGGQDILNLMSSMILEKISNLNEFFANKHALEKTKILRAIKDSLSEVSITNDFSSNSNNANPEDYLYELPDGQVIKIDKSIKFKPSEILFNPSIIDSKEMSITEMIEDSVSRCDDELQRDIFQNIIVCGGTSMTKGFDSRIQSEVNNILPRLDREVQVKADSFRKYSAWIGGSMMGSLASYQSLAITKSEYDENPEGKIALFHKRTL